MRLDREWAADFVEATELHRSTGHKWNELTRMFNLSREIPLATEALRALYRRAKAELKR